jgi:hypothetical protein
MPKQISRLGFPFLLLSLSVCVEPYDFRVKNNFPALIVEAQISDLSYNQTADLPSDGRYFEVSLRKTSDVTNIRDEVETNASVILECDDGQEWQYFEFYEEPGKYRLHDDLFKAEKSKSYRLKIELANGEQYQSSWESLPPAKENGIGGISFKEETIPSFKYIAGEKEIIDVKGVDLYIDLQANQTKSTTYYKWTFDPTWIYVAPFTSLNSSTNTCWITNNIYLSDYVLQEDNIGNYPQKLVFIETVDNDRIYKDFSLLIWQQNMTEDFFLFWKELQAQTKKGGLFDSPPYNLQSNFSSTNSEQNVIGYFGVVSETAVRWDFNIDDLSYQVNDRTTELCSISYGPDGPGGPECYNCLQYPYGTASNNKPSWWDKR